MNPSNPRASSSQSPRSWVSPTPAPHRVLSSNVSVSSWGTVATDAPPPKFMGTPTTFSFGSPTPSHGSPFGSSTVVSSQNGIWQSNTRPSEFSSLSSPSSSSPINGSRFPHPSVNAGPAHPPFVAINPCLNLRDQSNPLCIDLSRPPSSTPTSSNFSYHPNMAHSAFRPDMPSARIIIRSPNITWSLEIQQPRPLTVHIILYQVYHYLQQCDGQTVSSRMRPSNVDMAEYRDQNANRGTYATGVKRIDMLGPRRFCFGFEPAGERNSWTLDLSTGPY